MRKSYEIVGITGDASLYCLPCARKAYGDADITRVLAIEWTPNPPLDREGNELREVFLDGVHGDTCTECGIALEDAEYFV